MSGVHPYILAERMGVSLEYLRQMEEGTIKRSLKNVKSYIHFQRISEEWRWIRWIGV